MPGIMLNVVDTKINKSQLMLLKSLQYIMMANIKNDEYIVIRGLSLLFTLSLVLCMVLGSVLILFFYMYLSSFPSTTY